MKRILVTSAATSLACFVLGAAAIWKAVTWRR